MNDPNKAISVNLSSLLSLKAELLRKQHEVRLAKGIQSSTADFKPTKSSSVKEKSNDRGYKKVGSTDNGAKVYEAEDHAQLEKSRRVLEAKSKYYDKMSRNGGSLNSDDNCLVMFNRKKQEADEEQPRSSSESRRRLSSDSSSDDDRGHGDDDDDDEVEYLDCLGRTRKCSRKDLKEAKERDRQLAESMPERLDQTKANWMIDTKGSLPQKSYHNSDDDDDGDSCIGPRPSESVFSDALSTMTKHDEQRMNWERKEQENIDKPDVHYQDVFFDEARTHGVGYYAFSTDEDERRKQQLELEKARKATTAEQTRRDEIRAKRDRMVADRVLAAKNRIRARNGLPPISKEQYEREEQQKKDESAAEAAERERDELEKKAAIAKKKAKEEAELEELRKEHVRDWDRDKPGVAKRRDSDNEEKPEEWKYKAERLPMSQEEWNEKQRAQRQTEFAPMPEPVSLKRSNFSSVPPPPSLVLSNDEEPEFHNFHSTKKEKKFQRRNYSTYNEDENVEEPSTSGRGAAIPPPPGLDCTIPPPPAKRPKSQADLERSIEAGLKFLRENCDKGVLGNKATWTAKADY
ncbi:LOW QUALITY PROTEIN: coiled-coil domain-containing protein 174 [Drosophila eugracilis]|uniref:LOW QUALITY PROTEIN: coiled-coil domain-containing protein 174 n=1 Tax=Drosophila eugracilis TaxID=29029 RepID=UPI001BDAF7B6|nr:LOW QUALITY PROTEIN: coiled-coil domain-containing protein 174 [Drosophila eugracilis]